jgi:uncharacterized protein (DUF433 family)
MATALAVPFVYPHITKTPDVCGGQPCIDSTRVRVKNIAALHKEGLAPEQMLVQYPSLSLGQIHAALAYYYDKRGEIDAAMAADELAAEDFEHRRGEYLARHTAK